MVWLVCTHDVLQKLNNFRLKLDIHVCDFIIRMLNNWIWTIHDTHFSISFYFLFPNEEDAVLFLKTLHSAKRNVPLVLVISTIHRSEIWEWESRNPSSSRLYLENKRNTFSTLKYWSTKVETRFMHLRRIFFVVCVTTSWEMVFVSAFTVSKY